MERRMDRMIWKERLGASSRTDELNSLLLVRERGCSRLLVVGLV
jgi:hypothetical protein